MENTKYWLISLTIIICLITSQTVQSNSLSNFSLGTSLLIQESRFIRLQLPLGVSVEVPKNWFVLGGDYNTTIETYGEAILNLSGIELPKGRKVNLFRANSVPASTYASIAINATDSDIKPQDLKSATEQEIQQIGIQLQDMMKKTLPAQKLELLEFYGVRREYVGSHPALVFEYKRSGLQGPVIVQMTRLFIGEKEISMNLSYRESEGQIWKPIIQYIRKSLRLTKR